MSLTLPLLLLLWLRLAVRLNFRCIAEATIAAFAVPGDFPIKDKMIEIYTHRMDVHVSRATLKVAMYQAPAQYGNQRKCSPNTVKGRGARGRGRRRGMF